MVPEAEALAADAVASAAPVVGITPANVAEDPIQAGILRTCGVTLLVAHMTFINIEGLNMLAAFTQLNGYSHITGMAKRMAARLAASGRVTDQKAPGLGPLG
jgi:hypothetical protein